MKPYQFWRSLRRSEDERDKKTILSDLLENQILVGNAVHMFKNGKNYEKVNIRKSDVSIGTVIFIRGEARLPLSNELIKSHVQTSFIFFMFSEFFNFFET